MSFMATDSCRYIYTYKFLNLTIFQLSEQLLSVSFTELSSQAVQFDSKGCVCWRPQGVDELLVCICIMCVLCAYLFVCGDSSVGDGQ